MQTSIGYYTVLSSICPGYACTTAQTNLATNTACYTAVTNGTDIDPICVETCQNLLNAIVSNCNALVSQTITIKI